MDGIFWLFGKEILRMEFFLRIGILEKVIESSKLWKGFPICRSFIVKDFSLLIGCNLVFEVFDIVLLQNLPTMVPNIFVILKIYHNLFSYSFSKTILKENLV